MTGIVVAALPLQDDHRDLPVGLRLVPVVVRPLFRDELPQPLALLALRGARTRWKHLVEHLEHDIRVLAQIQVPARMRLRAAL